MEVSPSRDSGDSAEHLHYVAFTALSRRLATRELDIIASAFEDEAIRDLPGAMCQSHQLALLQMSSSVGSSRSTAAAAGTDVVVGF